MNKNYTSEELKCSFIKDGLHVTITRKKNSRGRGISIAFILLASLIVHPLPFFILILLGEQIKIKTHAFQINGKFEGMVTKLPLVKIKSFAKIL